LKLPFGKVPVEILKEVIFKNLGFKRREVILGPSAGFDGAVLDLDDKSLVASMDPITGAIEHIGWLAVNINANDVATFGVEPVFFLSCILLPEDADRKTIEVICSQMDAAAKNLKMAIIGGHCEVTPGLDNPIVIGCAFGVTDRGNYVTAGGAKPGDKLVLVKSAGIEGTAILATEHYSWLRSKGVNEKLLMSAKKFFDKISVVKEAILAFRMGGVNAMHDPTEGGILGGVHEMADASNLGVKIFEEKISIAEETLQICRVFKIDPLQLISSGALLIAADPYKAENIIDVMRKNKTHASIIGEFLDNPEERIFIKKNKVRCQLARPLSDHLWLALARA
jgi:hydrogenase maturation factor